MCDKRSAAFVFASFVAGLICAAWLHVPTLLDPIPEPYFGLEFDAAVQPPAVPRRASPARPPQRLAFGPAAAPITTRIESQALPMSGADQPGVVEHAAATAAQPELEPAAPQGVQPEAETGAAAAVAPPEEAARRRVPTDALKALVDRVRQARAPDATPELQPVEAVPAPTAMPPPAPVPERVPADAPALDPPAAADDESSGDAPAPRPAGRRFGLLMDRRGNQQPPTAGETKPDKPLFGGRLLDRVRGDGGRGLGIAARPAVESAAEQPAASKQPPAGRWPQPVRLFEQLEHLAHLARAGGEPAAGVGAWAADTVRCLHEVCAESAADTPDPNRLAPLLAASRAGGVAAETAPTTELATLSRRAALAVGRRAATWQAAAGVWAELAASAGAPAGADLGPSLVAGQRNAEVVALLQALERYESTQGAADAHAVRAVLAPLVAGPLQAAPALVQAVTDHYLAPNLRIAIHRDFVARVVPDKTVTSGRMEDFILGRPVRGTNTVEQSLAVAFVPGKGEIRCELQVSGAVSSRTVTDGGIADIHAQGTANFTVRKPIIVSSRGLSFGTALGAASNSARLAGIDTPFDAVPLMGGMMHKAVVSRYEESRTEAAREVNEKIIVRACRQVDREAEPKFKEMAERLRERLWMPMVDLGLEPTPVQLETSESLATVRLRLAGAGQLAAHTPRARVPEAAILSVQVHESTLNNGCQRLELADRRMTVEELLRTVCQRLGLPPHVPPDLPEGVEIGFAADEPLRVECRDGLVRLRLAIDTLQSGRRAWHDIVAQVAYRPVSAGMQVRLERDGKVKLSGPGQRGQLEIGLRAIFGKIFPAERPVDLLPATLVAHPRLADLESIQASASDGWFSLALAPRVESPAIAPAPPPAAPRRQAIGFPRPRRR
jgi:hypothetical protein